MRQTLQSALEEFNRLRKNSNKFNLAKPLRLALANLSQRDDIVIKNADKNLGVTVMAKSWYKDQCESHLQDQKVFAEVKAENIDRYLIGLELIRATSTLPPDAQKYILQCVGGKNIHGHPSEPRRAESYQIPHFYAIPKIHKTPISSRPIVPSMRWMTSDASRWVAKELNEVLFNHQLLFPQVLKDTKSLVRRIEDFVASDPCFLAVADVSSLYTNIPKDLGLRALKAGLEKANYAHTTAICKLMELILNQSYAQFNDRCFHQIYGTAMGTPAAPPYAILFLAYLEEILMARINFRPKMFLRYIDDILLVTSTKSQTEIFFNEYNKLCPSIKVSVTSSVEVVDFLDLTLRNRPGARRLEMEIHRKELNKYLYIPFSSYHPRPAKLSFIRTELMRFVRNSSSVKSYEKARNFFFLALRDRGYPVNFLLEAFSTIRYKNRQDYLMNRATRPPPQAIVKIPRNPNLEGPSWRRCLTLTLQKGVVKPTVAYLNPGSLRKKLIHAKFPYVPKDQLLPHSEPPSDAVVAFNSRQNAL